ncbi:hypothetical protein [Candidatus Poriferisocius sp.]|uniref:hypothetical protein n=1 Tax=Candidatus Poriferisocius sp. TaxID=3101276 RepID=UPI003B024A88
MAGLRQGSALAAAVVAASVLLWAAAGTAAAQDAADAGADAEAYDAPWRQWQAALRGAAPELEGLVAECADLLAANDPDWATKGCESASEHWVGAQSVTETWFSGDSTSAQTTLGVPITNYNIYFDGGGTFSVHRKFLGQAISWVWSGGIVALRFATWAFDWVSEGRLTQVIQAVPRLVADTLNTSLVHGLRLREVAMTTLAIATGWSVIRGRHAQAAGNAAFAILAMAVCGLILANFDGYYSGAQDTKNKLTAAVLEGAHQQTPGGSDTVALTSPLMDSVVHRPWQRLNFGRELQGPCEIAVGAGTLHRAAGSGDHYPRKQIKKCDPDGPLLDAFNRKPTTDRLFGGTAVLVGHLALAFLILSTALLALSSELLLAGAFGFLPVVAAAVAFPGGRRLVEGWVSMLLKGITGLAAGVLFLRLAVEVLDAISAANADLGMLDLFAVMVLVAIAAIKLRKALPEAASKISGNIGARLSSAGSGTGSGGGAALAGAGGAAAGLLAGGYLSAHLLGGQPPARAARHAASKARAIGSGVAAAGATGVAAFSGQHGGGRLSSITSKTKAGGGSGLAAAGATGGLAALGQKAHARRHAQQALAARDPNKMSEAEQTAVADRMDQAAHSNRRGDQLMAAQSKLTRQDALDHLAQSKRKDIREAIAARADNTRSRADELAMDPSRRVRASAVATGAVSADAALAQRRTSGATRRASGKLAADQPRHRPAADSGPPTAAQPDHPRTGRRGTHDAQARPLSEHAAPRTQHTDRATAERGGEGGPAPQPGEHPAAANEQARTDRQSGDKDPRSSPREQRNASGDRLSDTETGTGTGTDTDTGTGTGADPGKGEGPGR